MNPKLSRRHLVGSVFVLAVASCAGPNTPPVSVVFFQNASAQVDPEARRTIAAFADQAKSFPNRRILVAGYVESATVAPNDRWAQRRAQAVVDALEAMNLDRGRIDLRPRPPSASDPGLEGRRVELSFES